MKQVVRDEMMKCNISAQTDLLYNVDQRTIFKVFD